jgi:hypothetical protein
VSVTNLIETDSVVGTNFALSPLGPQFESVSEGRLPLNSSWFCPVPSNRYQSTTALSLVNFKRHSYPSVSFLVDVVKPLQLAQVCYVNNNTHLGCNDNEGAAFPMQHP